MTGIERSRNKKTCLTVITAALLIVSFAPSACLAYSGGSGSPGDPYLISTPSDMNQIGLNPSDWGMYFKLTVDINLSAYKGTQFSSIGTDTDHAFSGVFDGNGHTISGFTYKADSNDYIGIFRYISTAGKVKNVSLVDIDVNGHYNVGGLAGRNDGTISNCSSTGSVSGSRGVGGLVGLCYGSISNCYSTGSVSGNDDTGGLVGFSGGDIINCYSTGTVSGSSDYVGGLVGFSGGGISNCYSTGTVSGSSDYVGGLVGYNNNRGGISNCYSTGTVSGSSGSHNIGGLLGYNSGSVLGSFWDIDTSGQATSAGGTGKTTAEMKILSTFTSVGWDFVNETINGTSNYWQLSPGAYPVLSIFNGYIPPEPPGSGTLEAPYIIDDANDLGTIWYRPAAHYILANDINLAGIGWSTAVVPIFSGVLDGSGFSIKNLSITGTGYLGLFGQIEAGSSVKNLGIKDCNVSGSSDYVGGLAAENDGDINNCYSTGSVSGSSDSQFVGGLAGYNNSDISNCYSSGLVSGSDYVGGFVGFSDGGISNCYSTGSVNGSSDYVGGLEGYNDGDINNCYSTGSVNGSSDYVGGLTGGNDGDISNCYSTGSVSGPSDSNAGGLAGYNDGGSISNSYFLVTSGTDNGLGTPLTDTQMKQQSSFVGWDFVNIWEISEGVSYPKLVGRSADIEVAKCTVTAGSKDSSDAISFSGTMNATADDVTGVNVVVTIDSNDMVSPCVKTFPIAGNFKKGKFKCSASNASFALDTKTTKFSFKAKNVSLKGLSCPLTVQIQIGDSIGTTQVYEDVVNGAKPIPINLMMGVKNAIRVDKPKFTKKSGVVTQVAISGGFSDKNVNDVNLLTNPLDITVGSQTFTIPAGNFKNTKGKFACSKVDTSKGIVAVTFDFNKCTFTLTIKNTNFTAAGTLAFNMAFGSFSEGAEVSLP